jgi:hypothetical protein
MINAIDFPLWLEMTLVQDFLNRLTHLITGKNPD